MNTDADTAVVDTDIATIVMERERLRKERDRAYTEVADLRIQLIEMHSLFQRVMDQLHAFEAKV